MLCSSFDNNLIFEIFTKWQIVDSSKLKELADDNFKLDKNTRKFIQMDRGSHVVQW